MNLLKTVLIIAVMLLSMSASQPVTVSAAEKNTPLIAFAFSSVTTDGGWTMSHNLGRQAVEKKFPNVMTTFVEMTPFGEEASRIFQQFINDGAKMVFVCAEYGEFIYRVAEDNPEIAFLEANGTHLYDNVNSYYPEAWKAEYLLGISAGLMTKSNKLGYITSFPIPINYTSVNAFHLGARSVNPNVKTTSITINSWFDPPAHRQAAETLVISGVDVIYSFLDDPSAVQVSEEKGIKYCTQFMDRSQFGPNAYINGAIVDWGLIYKAEVDALLNGNWKGNRDIISPFGKSVDLGAWGKTVPKDVREKVEKVRQQILDGSFNPFVGPITNTKGKVVIAKGEELSQVFLRSKWDWAVEGVTGMD